MSSQTMQMRPQTSSDLNKIGITTTWHYTMLHGEHSTLSRVKSKQSMDLRSLSFDWQLTLDSRTARDTRHLKSQVNGVDFWEL